jgi:hypothetical protein
MEPRELLKQAIAIRRGDADPVIFGPNSDET